jgi:hypothetical protein
MFEIGTKINKQYEVTKVLHCGEYHQQYLLSNGQELIVDIQGKDKYNLTIQRGNLLLRRMLQKKVGDELNGMVIGERLPNSRSYFDQGERYQYGDHVLVIQEINHQAHIFVERDHRAQVQIHPDYEIVLTVLQDNQANLSKHIDGWDKQRQVMEDEVKAKKQKLLYEYDSQIQENGGS